MPTLNDFIARGETILTEGSVFELLRRDPRVRFDPHIAHSGLIYDHPSRALLASVHASYMAVARHSGLPMIAFTDTWRASEERIAASAFCGRSVNRDNVEFLREVAHAAGGRVFIAALTGPRGDAYKPDEAPSSEEARRLHAVQIRQLAVSGVDLIVAATLPSFEEARGIAALLSQHEVPWMLSFVVRPTGVLLDGKPLADAIREIDGSVTAPPVGYSINCVHPDIARQALSRVPEPLRKRVIAFQGNTSARTPEELDNLPHVETTAPEAFAASVRTLMRESSICVVGGCCGTDAEHIRALALQVARV